MEAKATKLRDFMKELSNGDDVLTEFDEQLWYETIDTVTVETSEKLIFRFKNGEEIEKKY